MMTQSAACAYDSKRKCSLIWKANWRMQISSYFVVPVRSGQGRGRTIRTSVQQVRTGRPAHCFCRKESGSSRCRCTYRRRGLRMQRSAHSAFTLRIREYDDDVFVHRFELCRPLLWVALDRRTIVAWFPRGNRRGRSSTTHTSSRSLMKQTINLFDASVRDQSTCTRKPSCPPHGPQWIFSTIVFRRPTSLLVHVNLITVVSLSTVWLSVWVSDWVCVGQTIDTICLGGDLNITTRWRPTNHFIGHRDEAAVPDGKWERKSRSLSPHRITTPGRESECEHFFRSNSKSISSRWTISKAIEVPFAWDEQCRTSSLTLKS